MPRDKHVRALAADIAGQDAELLEKFANKALWGGGEYAVAYAVLRFGQTVTRLITAMCEDDDERQAVQPAHAQAPESEAAIPESAVIAAAVPEARSPGKRHTRAANGQ